MEKLTLDAIAKTEKRAPKKEMQKAEKKSGITNADIEIYQNLVGNMTTEEQAAIVQAIDSSILEEELKRRRLISGDVAYSISEQIRRIDVKWAK